MEHPVASPAPKSIGLASVTPPPKAGNAPEMSVSELSSAIKRALEDGFGYVRLRGEISGYRGPHSSGHSYFALKDDVAKIDAVIWKGVHGRLKFKLSEGLEVVATGKVTSYPGSSKYQIVIEAMEPAGAGALLAKLEELKRKLGAEGLFDEQKKRRLPFMPRVVGIVTSPTGAVIRDMLAGFSERFPTHVVVWPVRVQGETCGAEVARAIAGFNALPEGGRLPRPDVLIVARGGGSLEDLWGFNDEALVRAVAASRIPIVSAVGHETDWTLIDLAADARAPTPTKAAEWVVPKYSELLLQVQDLSGRHVIGMRRILEYRRTSYLAVARGLPSPQDLVALRRQRFDAAEARLPRALLANTRAHAMRATRIAARLGPRLVENKFARLADQLAALDARQRDGLSRLAARQRARYEGAAGRLRPAGLAVRTRRGREMLTAMDARIELAMAQRLQGLRDRLAARAGLLGALSYQGVLSRGFALIRDGNGQMVRSAAQVGAGALLGLELHDGEVRVQALEDGRPAAPQSGSGGSAATAGRPRRAKAPDAGGQGRGSPRGGGQGSLF